MNTFLMVALAGAGLGFVLIAFKLFKKGVKIAAKLPTNFLIFFLLYAVVGLTGFFLKGGIVASPVSIGVLLFLVSLSGGMVMTYNLYEKWEWSASAGFGKKLLYLFGITLVSILAFVLIFLLCEHRGRLGEVSKNDLVWWYACVIFGILLPLLIKLLHSLWNDIPRISQLKQVFKLPIGIPPPFIETGGATVHFQFIIPLDYNSEEKVNSKVACPLNKTLEEVFHYKIHEHNIVKRNVRKIVYAEDNKRDKIYGWCFYGTEKIWWGWFTRKNYLDPKQNVGAVISNGDSIYVERVKIWEH